MVGSKIPWKKTLHLPKARFPSRPVTQDRPTYLKRCTDDLYAWQRQRDALKPFVLHDGPPYANGDLHVGHALNKILKDIICRSRISDYRVDWRPGWDCHGLPIELKALQQQGEAGAAGVRDAVGVRNIARKLAAKTVQKQKQTFQKWAVMADWDHPWATMDKQFVIKQLEVFKEMVKKGLIYRRFKPVYWSPSSRTALAEAELEYRDDHVSRAAFVKYPLQNASAELTKKLGFAIDTVNAVIWTTTPWTLPANRAIGINRGIEYTIAESSRHGRLLIATSRVSEVEHHLNEVLISIASIDGGDLIGVSYYDPVFGSRSESRPLLHADFVSESSGSGLVHFAPGHGKDEYELCLQNGIAAYAPVDENGCFQFEKSDHVSKSLQGLAILATGNDEVLRRMSERGQVICQQDYTHTYPYDWRSKQPVIVRATEQWFADLSDIRQKALQALEPVEFVPLKGRTRLETFIRNRSEWCISRQRAWGVPIPALYHSETGQAILTDESITHIISMIRDRGIDAWWTDSELDPAWAHHSLRVSDSQSAYRRGKDTMDVWFDSGTSWTQTASSMSKDSNDVADCYLEGTDQHRGWFQSSLLTYVAQQDVNSIQEKVRAPFKSLITHGFTLDQAGLKMSKSVGNVVSPDEIMEGKLLPLAKKRIDGQWKEISDAMGPDVLRLWVASSDYVTDVKISQAVLQTVTGSYLKYRLTFKLMLGILEDFAPSSSACADNLDGLSMIHQVALIQLANVAFEARSLYDSFEFNRVISLINKYISNDLSSSYFEWIKDAAYCGTFDERAQVHATLYQIFNYLQQMLAPITPLLIEEVWDYTPKQLQIYEPTPPAQRSWQNPVWMRSTYAQMRKDVPELMKIVTIVKGIQEIERTNKNVGDSLQSYICIESTSSEVWDLLNRYQIDQLAIIFGVSSVKIVDSASELSELHRAKWCSKDRLDLFGGDVWVHVYEPPLFKCIRCWRYLATVDVDKSEKLCQRCEGVIHDLSTIQPELFRAA